MSESAKVFQHTFTNVDLTNILIVQDVLDMLLLRKGQLTEKVWNPWLKRDFVEEHLIEKEKEGALPDNLVWKQVSTPPKIKKVYG